MSSQEVYENWGRQPVDNNPWSTWNTPKEKPKDRDELDQATLGYYNHMWRTDPETARKAHLPHAEFSTESMRWVRSQEQAPVQIAVQAIHAAEVAVPAIVEMQQPTPTQKAT